MVRTETDKRAEDLVFAILAMLAKDGVDTLKTSDKAFHVGFAAALAKLREAGGELSELSNQFYADPVSATYDELDHALIAAEQFGLVRFPNPSYSRLQLTITPRVAEQLLQSWKDNRDQLGRAAETLYDSVYQQLD